MFHYRVTPRGRHQATVGRTSDHAAACAVLKRAMREGREAEVRDERGPIGGTWKNEGRWTWAIEREGDLGDSR